MRQPVGMLAAVLLLLCGIVRAPAPASADPCRVELDPSTQQFRLRQGYAVLEFQRGNRCTGKYVFKVFGNTPVAQSVDVAFSPPGIVAGRPRLSRVIRAAPMDVDWDENGINIAFHTRARQYWEWTFEQKLSAEPVGVGFRVHYGWNRKRFETTKLILLNPILVDGD